MQSAVFMELRNVKDGKLKEAEQTAKRILADIAREGIDKKQLTASFNVFEFRTRERDFGSFPIGLAYGVTAMETWLYGGDPIRALLINDDFDSLRAKLDGDYFERLLSSLFEAEDGTATLYMTPDAALGEARSAKEKAALAEIRRGMSDEEFARIKAENEALVAWQKADQNRLIGRYYHLDLSRVCPVDKVFRGIATSLPVI